MANLCSAIDTVGCASRIMSYCSHFLIFAWRHLGDHQLIIENSHKNTVMVLFQELKERVLKGKYRIPYYMSTDCENLVRKFLVVSPAKRTTLEVDMFFFCVCD